MKHAKICEVDDVIPNFSSSPLKTSSLQMIVATIKMPLLLLFVFRGYQAMSSVLPVFHLTKVNLSQIMAKKL
jgi:hypothetical protein